MYNKLLLIRIEVAVDIKASLYYSGDTGEEGGGEGFKSALWSKILQIHYDKRAQLRKL